MSKQSHIGAWDSVYDKKYISDDLYAQTYRPIGWILGKIMEVRRRSNNVCAKMSEKYMCL